MTGLESVIIILILGGAGLLMGAPVGAVMAVASAVGFFMITGSITAATSLVSGAAFNVTSSLPYLVIPMFILMGLIATKTNIIRDLFDAAYKLVGRLAGGLAVATCLAAAGFASVTGSSISSAAAMGKIALPEMRKFGYDPSLSAGVVVASGTFAMMLPPSILLVFYGFVANVSVGKLLLAGILPGLLTVVVYVAQILLRVKMRPELGPKGPRFGMSETLLSVGKSSPFLIVLITLIGGILAGVWGPTEASAGGVLVVTLLGFARRELAIREIVAASFETIVTTSSIFLLIIGSLLFSKFLAITGITADLTAWVIAQDLPPYLFFFVLIVFYVVLGTFLEAVSMIGLTVPLVLPIVAELGWNPIWFGIVMIKMAEIGAVTPPVGLNLYALKGAVQDLAMKTIIGGSLPFWVCDIVVLFILFMVPELALILPNLL